MLFGSLMTWRSLVWCSNLREKVEQTAIWWQPEGLLYYYCRHQKITIRAWLWGRMNRHSENNLSSLFSRSLNWIGRLTQSPRRLSPERVLVINPQSKGFKLRNRNVNQINGSQNPSSTMRETFLESRLLVWRCPWKSPPNKSDPLFSQRNSLWISKFMCFEIESKAIKCFDQITSFGKLIRHQIAVSVLKFKTVRVDDNNSTEEN